MNEPNRDRLCRILSLDGGGAKGFYTLGVLKEIEALVGAPLCERFDLVFGTSTGSIIAALVGLGRTVEDIRALYQRHVLEVVAARWPWQKSAALQRLAAQMFGNADFTAMRTDVGIVCTRWDFERPMIFKTSLDQAHGRTSTFVPGFGCTIGDAVEASCSAYPFFKRKTVRTGNGESVVLIDGGLLREQSHPIRNRRRGESAQGPAEEHSSS
jgi:predicted acylesterase/phospholipase RssA